ncbi:unnamed protein product [Lactuca saligna]|uniref:Uncharacterized protein n=1 Tax=Lactuca saligna TaxID=75948 RepID=A0AA35VCR6_LACSI|nr:unnamed protein product [Lactuca saligna]
MPLDEESVELEPATRANEGTFNYAAYLKKCIGHMFNLLELLGCHWINYYSPIFGEEAIILPPPLTFIITGLYAFAEIKSQGADFPFQTHPLSTEVAIASLLLYGLASAADHFISVVTPLGPASVYAIVARLGRLSCLCILMISLASFFCL